jgi:Uncharacterized protein conserved in bacteria (DUF2252)
MTLTTEGDVSAGPVARASGTRSARSGTAEQLSRADRVARGKDARAVTPLEHWKFSAPIEAMVPSGMTVYARLCGWTLARAHARSGDRVALAAYLGGSDAFDQAITDFAETYADQNERDYAALQNAVDEGKVDAATGI